MHSQSLIFQDLPEIQKQIFPSNLLGSLENINYFVDMTCGDTGRTTLPCSGNPQHFTGVCACNTYYRDGGGKKKKLLETQINLFMDRLLLSV